MNSQKEHKNSEANPKEIKEIKEIDLTTEKKVIGNKTRRTYDLVDDEIKTITLDNDIVVKLIANNKGVFVDFRKYYKGYPTKKGIRILASKFKEIAQLLDADIKKNVVFNNLEDLNNII